MCFWSQLAGADRLKTRSGDGLRKEPSVLKDLLNPQIAAQIFTFRELAAATSNFRPECFLGEGGFGRVYKGRLPNGQVEWMFICFAIYFAILWTKNRLDIWMCDENCGMNFIRIGSGWNWIVKHMKGPIWTIKFQGWISLEIYRITHLCPHIEGSGEYSLKFDSCLYF